MLRFPAWIGLVLMVIPSLALAKEDVRQIAAEYSNLLSQEISLLKTMDDLDDSLRRREFELEQLQERRQKVAVHLIELEVRFESSTERLEKTRNLVRRRLLSIVMKHKTSGVDVLLDPESSLRSSLRERVLGKLLQEDRVRINAYREELENYEVERGLLESKRRELDTLEGEVKSTRARLEKDRGDRKNILRLVEEERRFFEKAYTDLSSAYKGVTDRISRLKTWPERKLEFGELKGNFRLPMSYAKIVTPYGQRKNRRLGTSTIHPGLEIRSSGSESVRAVYWGRVAFAGTIHGYGTTVILDHTQGYYTLYSRLKATLVNVGDIIESRQVIGTVGGNSVLGKEGTLYFELRERGKAVNPMPWFDG